jgi:hypothetical protein
VANPKGSCATIGIYVVNAQIYPRASRSKDGRSAYETDCGKQLATTAVHLLDPSLVSCAQTEYGYTTSQEVMK